MVKAVIFDMDGTLVNSERMINGVMQSLFQDVGIVVTEEEDRELVGRPIDANWAHLKEKHGLKHTVEELVEWNLQRYFEHAEKGLGFELMPGVEDFLKELHSAQIHKGLSTSSPRPIMHKIIGTFDLHHHLPVLSSADDVVHGKPAPDIFLRTAELLGVDPKDCVVFEDAAHGVTGAKAAGMKCIGYSQNGGNRQDISEADKIIDCYTRLTLDDLHELF